MASGDDWTRATARALGDALEHAVDHGGVPGGAVAIGTPDGTRFTTSRGVVAPECGPAAPDEHTVYDLASLTKVVVTWPLIGRAVRDGLLDLDSPLRSWFPHLPAPGRDLTVTHLMSHTAGLLPHTRLDRYHHSERPLAEHICAEPLTSEPGSQHRYIDRGFILLGLLLPELHGRDLAQLATDLWRELGLTETAYGPLARSPQVAPTEQRLLGAPRTWGIPHDPSAALLGGIAGHAGAFSTTADLARFAEQLLDPAGEFAEWFTASRRPRTAVEPGVSRGLAWLLAADGSVAYHHGYTGTSLFLSPAAGRYIVLCTNAVYHGWNRARLSPVRDLALQLIARPE